MNERDKRKSGKDTRTPKTRGLLRSLGRSHNCRRFLPIPLLSPLLCFLVSQPIRFCVPHTVAERKVSSIQQLDNNEIWGWTWSIRKIEDSYTPRVFLHLASTESTSSPGSSRRLMTGADRLYSQPETSTLNRLNWAFCHVFLHNHRLKEKRQSVPIYV